MMARGALQNWLRTQGWTQQTLREMAATGKTMRTLMGELWPVVKAAGLGTTPKSLSTQLFVLKNHNGVRPRVSERANRRSRTRHTWAGVRIDKVAVDGLSPSVDDIKKAMDQILDGMLVIQAAAERTAEASAKIDQIAAIMGQK
jgi:hypothetical protein